MSFRSRAAVKLSILDARQADRIHEATLEIMSRTGVVVQSREALSLLADAGATVAGERVKIPDRLVAKAIETALESITIYDRQGKAAMSLEEGRTCFGTGSDCPSVIDPETGETIWPALKCNNPDCPGKDKGQDGRPFLFDFQISWYWPRRFGGRLWPVTLLRNRLQQADRYHCRKLQRRMRPDQMTDEEIAASRRRPFHMRVYSVLTRPFTRMRRRLLNRIDPSQKRGERGRIHSRPD